MQNNKRKSGVDKGMIAIFLKMSVDERLLANDNAVSTIKELRVDGLVKSLPLQFSGTLCCIS